MILTVIAIGWLLTSLLLFSLARTSAEADRRLEAQLRNRDGGAPLPERRASPRGPRRDPRATATSA